MHSSHEQIASSTSPSNRAETAFAQQQPRVKVLDPHVIDCIAAGEVIERPASVLKELLENALDAHARRIQIDIENGGLGKLIVSDDGCGMLPEDALHCIERHATSKMQILSDLTTIQTLGFRGEALAAISAVSKMTLTTRTKYNREGFRIYVEAGRIIKTETVGCPIGTSIEVAQLFYNTPARLKFLRSVATEQAYILEQASRIILGYHKVSLMVRVHGRVVLDVPERADLRQRLLSALRVPVGELYPFVYETDTLSISGYVASPEETRPDAKAVWYFVNGRFVRDRLIQKALLDCYRDVLGTKRFPILIVYMQIDPTVLDVNVHPQKLEVRFAEPGKVFSTLQAALRGILSASPWQKNADTTVSFSPTTHIDKRTSEKQSEDIVSEIKETSPCPDIVTHIATRFFLYALEMRFALIDWHMLWRLQCIEQLKKLHEGEGIASHPLLFPYGLPPDKAMQWIQCMSQNAEALERCGFRLQETGDGHISVCAIPRVFDKVDTGAFIRVFSPFLGHVVENTMTLDCWVEILRKLAPAHAIEPETMLEWWSAFEGQSKSTRDGGTPVRYLDSGELEMLITAGLYSR